MPEKKIRLAVLCVLVVVFVVVVAVSRLGDRVAVTGDTSAERVDSVQRLASVRPAGAATVLADAAANDPDPAVRRSAIAALGTFRRAEDKPFVEKALQDPDNSVRAAAAGALGAYGLETVTRLSALAQDPDPKVRLGAVTGLCQTGRGPGLAALLRIMAKDANPEVQLQALKAIEAVSNVRYLNEASPKDPQRWAAMVQRVRNNAWVQEELAKENAGKP